MNTYAVQNSTSAQFDSNHVISSSYDGLRVWDVRTHQALHTFDGATVFQIVNKSTVAFAGAQGVQLGNLATGSTCDIFTFRNYCVAPRNCLWSNRYPN